MRSPAIVLFFALSYWSSGVMLIRLFSSYDLLQNSVALALIYLVTIPVVYACVVAMISVYVRLRLGAAHSLSTLVALVLALHGIFLILAPQLYAVQESGGLAAAAWLLWFGAVALLIIDTTNSSKRA